jgi:hypothetical protein
VLFCSQVEVLGLQTKRRTGMVGGGGLTGEVGLNGGIVVGGTVVGGADGGVVLGQSTVEKVPWQINPGILV